MEKMQPETRLERLRRKLHEAQFNIVDKNDLKESDSEKESLPESAILQWKIDARSYLKTISNIRDCFNDAYRNRALDAKELHKAEDYLDGVADYLKRIS